MALGLYSNRVWYCSSVKYTAVTAWAATTAYSVGDRRRPTAASVGNERVFVCIVAGTSAGTEPTWPTTGGSVTETGGVKWQDVTGQPGMNGDSTNVITPNWAAGTSQTPTYLKSGIGNICKDGNGTGTHYFVMTTDSGSNASVEPTWNTGSLGATTTDNGGSVWTYIGLVNAFTTKWAAPHARLETVLTAAATNNTSPAGPYIIYLGHDHTQTQASTLTITGQAQFPMGKVICVSTAGSMPPVSADLATTATIYTTGSNDMSIGSIVCYWYGINWECAHGGGAFTANINWAASYASYLVSENCSFKVSGTVGGTKVGGYWEEHINDTFSIVNTASIGMQIYEGKIKGGSITGTWGPTAFLSEMGIDLSIEDFDLSALGTIPFWSPNSPQVGKAHLKNCKLPSGFVPLTPAQFGNAYPVVYVINTDSAGATNRIEKYAEAGNHVTSTSVVRTTGATDGVTPFSWRAQITSWVAGTTSGAQQYSPFEVEPLAIWNTTVGSSVNVTLYGIADPSAVSFTALPKNNEFWFDVQYLGTSSSTVGSIKTGGIVDVLTAPASLTADTSAWDTAATSRANSTLYAAGDIRKNANSVGQLWVCTTPGTSASSLGTLYTGIADGATVNDGTAVFTAMWRFKLTIAVTPQNVGLIYAYAKLAALDDWNQGSAIKRLYIDPKIVLS